MRPNAAEGLCACGCGLEVLADEACYRIRDGSVYYFCLGEYPNLTSHVRRWEAKHLNGHQLGGDNGIP